MLQREFLSWPTVVSNPSLNVIFKFNFFKHFILFIYKVPNNNSRNYTKQRASIPGPLSYYNPGYLALRKDYPCSTKSLPGSTERLPGSMESWPGSMEKLLCSTEAYLLFRKITLLYRKLTWLYGRLTWLYGKIALLDGKLTWLDGKNSFSLKLWI